MRYNNLIDKKLTKNIDYGLIVSVILLIIIGVFAIASATQMLSGGSTSLVKVQIVAFVLGVIAVLFVLIIDYNNFGDMSRIIYIVNILLLCSVFIFGSRIKGSLSWIKFGFLNFQPSEVVKLGFILTFAKHLEKRKDNLDTIFSIVPSILHMSVPIGLILLQPDFGTAAVFLFIAFFMMYAAGLNYKIIFTGFLTFMVSMPAMWFLFLKPYQKNRILVLFNPELDPMGAGYHVIQSKIAIGSGRFGGKGLFKGTQNNLGFLPESHTDFIFSVIGEELGFIGAIVVVLLFIWMFMRCIHIAKVSKDDYGMLICVGVIAMYLFHIFENIGMTIGIMPVTGIPLPFISYGGSSLLTNMIAIGLILNVGMRRQIIRF